MLNHEYMHSTQCHLLSATLLPSPSGSSILPARDASWSCHVYMYASKTAVSGFSFREEELRDFAL